MLIDNYTAHRTALEAQLDAFIFLKKGEQEANRVSKGAKGNAEAPFVPLLLALETRWA